MMPHTVADFDAALILRIDTAAISLPLRLFGDPAMARILLKIGGGSEGETMVDTTKKVDEGFPVQTMRREGKDFDEVLSARRDTSGLSDEIYHQVRKRDGTSVTIQGNKVIVADRYEEDVRVYDLGKGASGLRIFQELRLRATPSGGTHGGPIEDERVNDDRPLIEGAIKMYERARAEPAGFRPSDPFTGKDE
jgi:hypothetical protein